MRPSIEACVTAFVCLQLVQTFTPRCNGEPHGRVPKRSKAKKDPVAPAGKHAAPLPRVVYAALHTATAEAATAESTHVNTSAASEAEDTTRTGAAGASAESATVSPTATSRSGREHTWATSVAHTRSYATGSHASAGSVKAETETGVQDVDSEQGGEDTHDLADAEDATVGRVHVYI